MIKNVILPMEIINKIFSYMSHDSSIILNHIIKDYRLYIKDCDDTINFYDFIYKPPMYFNDENAIKLHRKHNDDRLRCYNCGKYFKTNDLYYKSCIRDSINCLECFSN